MADHRTTDTARRSEVNVTVVKRNRGVLLVQRSLPRRQLAQIWASGHEATRGRLPAHPVGKEASATPTSRLRSKPAPGTLQGFRGRSKFGTLSFSDGILNTSSTSHGGSSNDRHGPTKRGQRGDRQAESRCAAGTASLPRRGLARVVASSHEATCSRLPALPVGKEASATPTSRLPFKLAPGTLQGFRGRSN